MIGFAESFLAWVAATFIPAFLGLFIITLVGRKPDRKEEPIRDIESLTKSGRARRAFRRLWRRISALKVAPTYLLAFALGIFFWFFVDTISGSALLDVNSGFNGGSAQFGVVVLFLVGFLFFITIDRNRGIFTAESAIGTYGMLIPMLVAIAVGMHGLGEGAAYGATAYSTTSSSLIDAFGGTLAGVAYVLHKGLEPMMIGAYYVAYHNWKGKRIASWLRNLVILSILFVLPSLVGATTGYYYSWDATYAFALGTGTSIYVIFRLAAPLFLTSGAVQSRQTLRIAIAWVLGFMAIYFAALFHS